VQIAGTQCIIGRKAINPNSETVTRLPMFRDAYRLRRGIPRRSATKAASSPTLSR